MYTLLLCLHVVVAISGVGQLGAIALCARQARGLPFQAAGTLERSLRLTRYALIAMFVTGALLDASAHGAYHESMWFRASALLILIAGIFHARAVAALRRARAASEPSATARALVGVEGFCWAACAVVALITVLMEAKPI